MTTTSPFAKDGWLSLASHRPSPNFDARPAGCVPDLLVIHAISLPPGVFGNAFANTFSDTASSYIDDLFLNQLELSKHPDFEQLGDVRVSAHFLIRRNGNLVQFVATDQRAWHAGASSFMGRERCNDFSIGIELEGSDFVPFESAQYVTLVNLTGALLQHYPISHIAGHQHIAPGRKTDPGPFFEWSHYQHLLHSYFPTGDAGTKVRFPADR